MIIDSPIISGSYAATGSLNQVGNVVITGSLTVTEQITGSINTASFAAFAISASNALTASYLSNYIPPFPYTGSAGISGSLSVNGDITSNGTLTAQTLVVQVITSSVDFVTGSTRFGSELTNTHLFTGSVAITGSLAVNGSSVILTNQTGAMSVATASYVANAVSASYALTASLAPLYLPLAGGTMTGDIYAAGRAFTFQDLLLGAGTTFGKLTTDGSKYISIMPTYNVESARFWPNGNVTIQDAGTYVDNGFKLDVSGSGRFTNGLTVTGSIIAPTITGSLLGTASFANNATSASYALTASFASNVPATSSFAISASQAESASYALTASFASNVPATSSFAVSASQAQNAVSAAYSAYALTSSYSLAGSGFPFSGSAVITGSLLITNLSSSGVSYLVADSTGFITAQSGSAAIFQTQIYTASAGQTTFAITNGYATGLINVFVNGTKLNPSEYTDTNGTTIVLATGSFVDDIVEFNKYLPASGVTNNTLRQLTTFTASAAQTVFSASYTPGLLDIYYNGSHLSNGDFTANNGTFITLATGSAAGDIIDVFVYSYQVGAFSGIGGAGVANEISYFNTTNSITSSAAITISGTNAIVTGSLLGTASYAANANLLDGLDSSVFVPTGSFNTFSSSLLTYTGSADSRFSALETTSGSNITRISALESASGSAITRLGALETASGSAITRLSSIESTTGSLNAASGSAITRLSSIESKTGSYATTGSNIFVDGQYLSSSFNPTGFSTTASLYTDGGLRVSRDAYISGTLYLNNVTVFGTQSVAYISSSQLNIGTNLITVNTDTPSIRFGGLAVYDSGSTGLTGSILWDSQNNHWVYSNPSGSSYSGGMFISGPRTSTLGSETGTTSCMLMAGQGGDHITSSMIYHSSVATCFYGNSFISSSGAACFASDTTIGGNLYVGNTSTTSSITLTGASVGGFTAGYMYWGNGNQTTAGLHFNSPGTNVEITTGFNERVALSTGTGLQVYTNNGVGAYTSRMLLDRSGNACFSGNVCALTLTTTDNINLSNDKGIFIKRADGTLGQALFLGSGNELNIGFGVADVIRFATYLNTERLRITNTGIACFSCQVCAPAFVGGTVDGSIINSTSNAFRFSGNNALSLVSLNSQNVVKINAAGYWGTQLVGANDKGVLIDNTGNVGIGATAPSSLLHICGAGTGTMLRIQNTTTVSGDQGPLIQFMSANQVGNQNFETGYIQSVWTAEGNAFGMRFATKGVDTSQSEKMRITSSGRVGIGISTPDYPLHIYCCAPTGMKIQTCGSSFGSPSINLLNGGVDTVLSATNSGLEIGTWSANNILFKTTQQTRATIFTSGETCFAGTVCSFGSIARKGYDFHTNGQWYKIPFYLEKGNGQGLADTRCIVVINNNDSFQELHFTIEYGSRLQGVSDQATQTSLRSYGVNRFNSGTITVNDTYLITGGSGCAINTHAPVTVAPVGSCMSVVKVDFSTSLGNSSFVWGEVRIWSIESLTGKISIPNNNY
jgi:hypothetical protein